MTQPERIFIIGHMGAGKALFAEALAKKLNWQFIDANPSLERYIGRNLSDILGEEGEAAFHRCEGEIISHYKNKKQVVVLLEEAVIAAKENRQLLSDEFVIYLQVSTQEQMKRMQGNRVPLLPIADLNAFLDEQHRLRDHLYEEVAAFIIESISVEDDVAKVIQVLLNK